MFLSNQQFILADLITTAQRAFCECDFEFTQASLAMDPINGDHDSTQCKPFHLNGHNKKCCELGSGLFVKYDADTQFCCSNGNVASIGSC